MLIFSHAAWLEGTRWCRIFSILWISMDSSDRNLVIVFLYDSTSIQMPLLENSNTSENLKMFQSDLGCAMRNPHRTFISLLSIFFFSLPEYLRHQYTNRQVKDYCMNWYNIRTYQLTTKADTIMSDTTSISCPS